MFIVAEGEVLEVLPLGEVRELPFRTPDFWNFTTQTRKREKLRILQLCQKEGLEIPPFTYELTFNYNFSVCKAQVFPFDGQLQDTYALSTDDGKLVLLKEGKLEYSVDELRNMEDFDFWKAYSFLHTFGSDSALSFRCQTF